MSQWAREHPELCAEGVDAYDYYAERGDRVRQERKDGASAPDDDEPTQRDGKVGEID